MPRNFASRNFGPQTPGGGGGGGDPGSPILTVADAGNGTDATATITGTDSGAANVVYVAAFDPALGPQPLSNEGNRSGNGDVSLTLTPGHYVAIVLASLDGTSAISPPVYFSITDAAAEAPHYRMIEGVRIRVGSIGLAGIDSANIVSQHTPSDIQFNQAFSSTPVKSMPGVLIAPFANETMNPTAGTNYRDEIGFPIVVTLFDRQERIETTNLNRNLLWRHQVAAAFRNQRLPGVPEVENMIVEPGQIVMPESWFRGYWHSALVVRCFGRFTRGI